MTQVKEEAKVSPKSKHCDHCGRNDTHEAHPDDVKMRIEGEAEGKEFAPAFVRDNADEMLALIATYSDYDAENLFEKLRERFWSTPRAKR